MSFGFIFLTKYYKFKSISNEKNLWRYQLFAVVPCFMFQ